MPHTEVHALRSLEQFQAHYNQPQPFGGPATQEHTQQQYQVRCWREGDDLALLEVFADASDPQSHQDRTLLRASSDEPLVRTLVVEDAGVPVAAGSISASTLHPQRAWLYVEVMPGLRREGIGTALVRLLRAEISGPLKIRATVDSPAAAFAQAQGWQAIQYSRNVALAPQAVPAPDLQEHSSLQLSDLATGSVELTQVVHHFYQRVHDWDPTVMSLGQAQSLLLSPASGASGAVVLRDQRLNPEGPSPIVAFAISYTPSVEEQEEFGSPVLTDVLLGHNPELGLSEDSIQYYVRALLGMLVHHYPVRVEVDDSMTALNTVLEELIHANQAKVLHTAVIAASPNKESE